MAKHNKKRDEWEDEWEDFSQEDEDKKEKQIARRNRRAQKHTFVEEWDGEHEASNA